LSWLKRRYSNAGGRFWRGWPLSPM
jgi:hypothetical protein